MAVAFGGQPRIEVRLLPKTLRLETGDAIPAIDHSARRLLQDQADAAAANGTGQTGDCPPIVDVGTNTGTGAVDPIADPTCSGAGLVTFKHDMAEQKAEELQRDRRCALAVFDGINGKDNSTCKPQVKPQVCGNSHQH